MKIINQAGVPAQTMDGVFVSFPHSFPPCVLFAKTPACFDIKEKDNAGIEQNISSPR